MQHSVPNSRIADLANNSQGLTSLQAEVRLREYGRNAILEESRAGWMTTARDTLRDPMIWFLVGTAVLFASLGEFADAVILGIALLPIAGMDAYLHRRTQVTTEGLRGRLASLARVVRDDVIVEIPAIDIVPGDLVIVAEGTPFPADGLIVGGDGLQVDESALTGESMPVRKRSFVSDLGGVAEHLIDDIHWGAAGTRLLTGEARLRLVHTGADTLYGQIVRSARQIEQQHTPLQKAVSKLVGFLIVAALILCIGVASIRYYQGYGATDAALSALTLAIAALPEEFPVALTFFLGVGVYRLARRKALVRRSVVVENIGRVTCICTDKTGTLTEGQLRLAHKIAADRIEPEFLARIAATATRPNSADPLDVILQQAAAPMEGTRLQNFPFTEDRLREVTILRTATGAIIAAAKGAPEMILAMVAMTASDRELWLARTRELARDGHKVIGCAFRDLRDWSGDEPDRDYQLAGLLALEDPVRSDVARAVADAQAAKIRVIMVTGDHVDTALAIARELQIGGADPRAIEGTELTAYLGSGKTGADWDIDVIARARPSQKLELVRALQRAGEVVAVTGDGVNDVPALQGADVGIAMGERGTRSAREAASIVLLDDNFRTIVTAIAEGRQLFRNLKLSFAYLIMVHVPLVATAALVPFLGFPLLYLPVHIVWLELIIHPTALLVFQQAPPEAELAPASRRSQTQFFDFREWTLLVAVGAMITALIMFGYYFSLGPERDVLHARSIAMVALVIASATVAAALSGLRSRSAAIAVGATILSALLIVQTPQLAALVHMSPLHLADWLVATVGGVLAGSLAMQIPGAHRPRRDSQATSRPVA